MTARLAAAVIGLAVALTGCGAARQPASTGGAATGGGATGGAGLASYVEKAHLDPCPALTATSAGGLHSLTLPCLGNGAGKVDLSRLRGPALVNMWASWCGPCQEEVPILEQVHRAAKGRMLVLGVDIQETSRRSALAFAAAVGMHYPSLYDADGAFRVAEHAPAPPTTLFVDRDGRVVHRKVGLYPTVTQVRADVARYLGVRL